MSADRGLARLREQHTRDKAMSSICGECGWPFPCATVRLLDRLASLEEALRGIAFLTDCAHDPESPVLPGYLTSGCGACMARAALAGTPSEVKP